MCSDEAQDRQHAVATPPSPTTGQPCRLLVHPGKVTRVVGPGLGLDYHRHPGGGDRHRIDVSPALPGEGVPKPPALRLKRGERPLDLVLRASTDPTATSQRKPPASVEAQED